MRTSIVYHRRGNVPIPKANRPRLNPWTRAQYSLLKIISPREPTIMDGSAFAAKGKIKTLLGDRFLDEVRNKTVLDFGCGEGAEAVEMALAGATKVIGLDLQEHLLDRARERARAAGVEQRCAFATQTDEMADLITSFDAFEHFAKPEAILRAMHSLL